MNTLLFLTACIAVAIIIGAYKFLKWQAILGLGILFCATSGLALLLDHVNDDIVQSIYSGQQTSTGIRLFENGPEVSILGLGWNFFFIAFCCGIALAIFSLVKKRNTVRDDDVDMLEVDEEPLLERERIRMDLKDEIYEISSNEDDPKKQGQSDAELEAGPFPSSQATEPTGYEREKRNQYQALGSEFLAQTVGRLMQEIGNALAKLQVLKNQVSNQPYARMADARFGDTATPTVAGITAKRTVATNASKKWTQFKDSLKLKPAEEPDWVTPRTSVKKLLLIGSCIALFEFVVNYILLESRLGEDAIKVAGVAVVLVLVIAFTGSLLFQHMRRNRPLFLRTLATLTYGGLLYVAFVGFGLLLNWRDVKAKEHVSDKFDAMLSGYVSLLTDLTNLSVFLINIIALFVFYWKSLLLFDRFYGYGRCHNRHLEAQKNWADMFESNEYAIEDALTTASKQAEEDSTDAERAFESIQEKQAVLEGIRSIITGAYNHILHPAYRRDINDYRNSNCDHRAIQVNPAPNYFHAEPVICATEEYFTEELGIEEFLELHKEAITRSGEDLETIQQTSAEWNATERPDLRERWNTQFVDQVNNAGRV